LQDTSILHNTVAFNQAEIYLKSTLFATMWSGELVLGLIHLL